MGVMGMYSTVNGQNVAHYQHLELIGHGGMGQVYKAHDVKLGRTVALKFLPPWQRGNPQSKKILTEEAKAASKLSHPNIVTVHDVDEIDGVNFIVMEFVAGRALNQELRAGNFSPGRALDCAVQIADALASAHAAGILHGDLKPQNMMVTEDGRVKILDWGLARALTEHPVRSDSAPPSLARGTKLYMAPEQLRTSGVAGYDARSEIFAFGLIFFELLTGRHAFGPGTSDQIQEAISNKEPTAAGPEVPAILADIAIRCLSKSPADRFQSMNDVLLAMEHYLGAMPASPQRPSGVGANSLSAATAELDKVRAITGGITYTNVARSGQALHQVARLLEKGAAPAVRDAVKTALKDVLLTLDQDKEEISRTTRKVRQLTLNVLKLAAEGDLSALFQHGELVGLDLFGMDFSCSNLAGVSFEGCFLATATFHASRLAETSFVRAFGRNVDFAQADVTGADLTDFDWFNAYGWTEDQLRSVRRGTLRRCPPNVEELHQYLRLHYRFPFESWPAEEQDALIAAWNKYLRPGGLGGFVAAQRAPE